MTKQPDKITALYCRLSRDDEQDGMSGSHQKSSRPSSKNMHRRTASRTPACSLTTAGRARTLQDRRSQKSWNWQKKGLIGTLIVKDHSRLGRNRLIVGQLLEEGFDNLGVRYIAIMDNIDTAKGTQSDCSDAGPVHRVARAEYQSKSAECVQK